jgi:hypothetical protein
LDQATAQDLKSYQGTQAFTYAYREAYGGDPVDVITPTVTKVTATAKTLRITLDRLVQGHIYELRLPGVKSTEGKPLLHDVGYYTLNEIPN